MPTLPNRLLDKEETAEFLHISVAQLDRLRQMGAIKWTRIGEQVRFRPDDVTAYIEANEGAPSAQAQSEEQPATASAAA